MKIISPKIHGIIDYLVVLFLFISPTVFNMAHSVAVFTYALGAIHLVLTLLTNFSAGLVKLIPLPLHGLIELVVGIALVALAFTWLKDDETAKLFYTGFGAAVLAVFFLSDYKAA
jgi:cadmium resistance protein CadD (predicted permease)